MNTETKQRFDYFKGLKREWRNGSVYTGLVSLPAKGGYGYYGIRLRGEMIRVTSGCSQKLLRQAAEIVSAEFGD